MKSNHLILRFTLKNVIVKSHVSFKQKKKQSQQLEKTYKGKEVK